MSASRAIRAGRAFVELFADDSKLIRGLRRAQARLRAWGATVRKIGLAIFAGASAVATPLLAAAKSFVTVGDQLDKMASRTGVSVEALSRLSFAAEQSGSNLETLESGLAKMQRKLADAAGGSQSAQAALAALGLSAGQLAGLSPDKQFEAIADGIQALPSPALKTAAAIDVFGKAGQKLLPLLNNGAEGVRELTQEAERLGLTTFSPDTENAAKLGDAMNRLWRVLQSGIFRIGAALAPTLIDLVDRITEVAAAVSKWIDENRPLIVTILGISAAAAAVGAVLIAAGIGFQFVAATVGALATVATVAWGAFVAGLVFVKAAVLTLLSPVGLVIAAVAALGGVVLYQSGVIQKAVEKLPGLWSDVKDDALTAWDAIRGAIASGDLGAAANVAWTFVKLVWARAIGFLQERWTEFTGFVKSVFNEAWAGVAAAIIESTAAIAAGWTETVDFLSDVWSIFTTSLTKSWNTAIGFIRKAWVKLKGLFSDDVDVEAEVKRINQETADKNATADDDRNRKIWSREEARRKRLAEIERDRRGALDENEQMRSDREKAIRSESDRRIAELEAELQEARASFNDAVARAKESARKKGEQDENGFTERILQTGQNLQSAGTFSARAVAGLGTSPHQQRILAALQNIEKNTHKLPDLTGAEFE